MCLMKRDHVGGENMIKGIKFFKKTSTFVMEDEEVIAELLYSSFRLQNEQRFNKTSNQPKVNQKSVNKMISQRYQNVSMKRNIKKSALYCGKVKF